MKEVVYKPRRGSADLRALVSSMVAQFPTAWSLGYRLAVRNIRARYRQSLLGLFWALLPPLLTSAVWILLRSQNVFEFGAIEVPYPLFVLMGTMLWQVFSESMTIFLNGLNTNRSLLVKINFPQEALAYAAFIEVTFNLGIKVLLIGAAMAFYQVPPNILVLPAIGGMLILVMLGLSISLLLSPVAMLYKDILLGVPVLLQFAMYLTPVVYAKTTFTGIASIMNYNPVTPVLTSIRSWLLAVPGDPMGLILVGAISLGLLVVGLIAYRISLTIVIERIGS